MSNSAPSLERALKAYRKFDLSQVTPQVARPVVKRAKWLNATEMAQLIERYQGGATTYELGEQFGIGRETVATRLKAEGIKVTDKEFDAEGKHFAAGSLLISGVDDIKLTPMLHDLSLDAIHLAAEPSVATHAALAPRVAFMHTWLATQTEAKRW